MMGHGWTRHQGDDPVNCDDCGKPILAGQIFLMVEAVALGKLSLCTRGCSDKYATSARAPETKEEPGRRVPGDGDVS